MNPTRVPTAIQRNAGETEVWPAFFLLPAQETAGPVAVVSGTSRPSRGGTGSEVRIIDRHWFSDNPAHDDPVIDGPFLKELADFEEMVDPVRSGATGLTGE